MLGAATGFRPASRLVCPDPAGVTAVSVEHDAAAFELFTDELRIFEDAGGKLNAGLIDAEGALSLADADGAVQLVYSEAPVDVTQTDVDALASTLSPLPSMSCTYI